MGQEITRHQDSSSRTNSILSPALLAQWLASTSQLLKSYVPTAGDRNQLNRKSSVRQRQSGATRNRYKVCTRGTAPAFSLRQVWMPMTRSSRELHAGLTALSNGAESTSVSMHRVSDRSRLFRSGHLRPCSRLRNRCLRLIVIRGGRCFCFSTVFASLEQPSRCFSLTFPDLLRGALKQRLGSRIPGCPAAPEDARTHWPAARR